MNGTLTRAATRKPLVTAILLTAICAAALTVWWVSEPEPDPLVGATGSCSTCDARHRNLETRIEAVRKLRLGE